MPLHLLGKKSWNVYNPENIARVRRDEAIAKAAEDAKEQRLQQIDSERRLAILRGEAPPPLESGRDDDDEAEIPHRSKKSGSGRKRKRQGEDDTDFELRLAREKNRETERHGQEPQQRVVTSSAPIVDGAGHIDLFGDERSRAHAEKNAEVEAESRRRQQEYRDQYRMRLASAAGKSGPSEPWYSQQDLVAATTEVPYKDVWGREDPQRKQRQVQRLAADDPLVIMNKGVSRIRELKAERKRLQEEREEELRSLKRCQRREDERRRSRSPRRRRDERRTGSRQERETRSRYDRDTNSRDDGKTRSRHHDRGTRSRHHDWEMRPRSDREKRSSDDRDIPSRYDRKQQHDEQSRSSGESRSKHYRDRYDS
ncbi:hypothetical protein L249_6171 [Ophiocordyceps polyrhachis-furcata BCC 54312]|uniref:CBF1-interacting co-repressor CIR N-terminal domain-containing protein n=1 Tax=Ophiocordyceps polyrhachis-furcata BCC 54312 TaxID=1330021 RepID=A0A367LIQ5_9HYPO|nr:hypothetical protein L249_6171 [Ophiocordyceps polyrhachis-furcata BCC 54312]